eukprot:CAMPEP_0178423440 /NCGR_PEP_ID=MMETSP0689_2-20121128/27690_1 /TAXON_ID=160604 /ORGANISM="Amphidinium massartii, Strain CS-259" /LENGTH=109 /DNA_ID=CAMNT_0020045035 /DNA_START=207 /DNA_END=536 /DNA_ORIENTATION=-
MIGSLGSVLLQGGAAGHEASEFRLPLSPRVLPAIHEISYHLSATSPGQLLTQRPDNPNVVDHKEADEAEEGVVDTSSNTTCECPLHFPLLCLLGAAERNMLECRVEMVT